MHNHILSSIHSGTGRRLLAIVTFLGILSLTLTYPALAQEKMPRTITVTGRGVEMIPTTKTQVQLGVQVQGQTATAVQQEVAQRSNAVIDLLQSRHVEKLQTTGIQLNPTYSYENNTQRLTGYVASNTVSFRLNTQQVGDLLDEAVKAGATQIDGISFVASDSAIATAQQQALREATADATSQADTVLGALKLTRREVVSIHVNNANLSPPRPLARAAANMAISSQPTPVVGGEQQVDATVTLEISY